MRNATISRYRRYTAGLLHLAAAAVVLSLTAAGCSLLPEAHRIDVQQGNIVDPSAFTELRTGMTSEQVRFLLGNPIISDPFHPQRWDYIYYVTPAGQPPHPIPKRLTLYFEDDVLTRVLDQFFDQSDAAQATDEDS